MLGLWFECDFFAIKCFAKINKYVNFAQDLNKMIATTTVPIVYAQ